MTYTIDLGNGAEDYELDTFQEAVDLGANLIERSYWDNYERGMSRAYTGRMDFDILCNGVVVRKAWASMNDCGFYKEKEMV